MSTNDTQTSNNGKAPILGGKIESKAKQMDGRLSELDGKTFDDPVEQFKGMSQVAAGRVEEAVGKATGNVIASAEKENYQDVWEGRAERLEGAMKQAVGQVIADWGRMTGQPDTVVKGLAKQLEGAVEKTLGKSTENAAKGAFGDALQADQNYVTGSSGG